MRVHVCRGGRCGAAMLAGVLTLSVAAALALAVACPSRAFASYKDAASSYPAMQDLKDSATQGLAEQSLTMYNSTVPGSQIPDGTYTVPAFTSSYMCRFYATEADANAKTNANRATITVSGGTITATFYLSGAYTAIYLGDADTAAQLGGEAGADGMTPSSAYQVDDSLEYGSGHGPYTAQMASLNSTFVFSVFSGGSSGISGGLWFTRSGSFIATTAFMETIGRGTETPKTPDDPHTEEPGSAGQRGGQETPSEPEPDPEPAGDSAEDASAQGSAEPTPEALATSYDPATGVRLGRAIHIVGRDEVEQARTTVIPVEEGAYLDLGGISLGKVIAIATAAVLAAGLLWRALKFRFDLKRRPPQ